MSLGYSWIGHRRWERLASESRRGLRYVEPPQWKFLLYHWPYLTFPTASSAVLCHKATSGVETNRDSFHRLLRSTFSQTLVHDRSITLYRPLPPRVFDLSSPLFYFSLLYCPRESDPRLPDFPPRFFELNFENWTLPRGHWIIHDEASDGQVVGQPYESNNFVGSAHSWSSKRCDTTRTCRNSRKPPFHSRSSRKGKN